MGEYADMEIDRMLEQRWGIGGRRYRQRPSYTPEQKRRSAETRNPARAGDFPDLEQEP